MTAASCNCHRPPFAQRAKLVGKVWKVVRPPFTVPFLLGNTKVVRPFHHRICVGKLRFVYECLLLVTPMLVVQQKLTLGFNEKHTKVARPIPRTQIPKWVASVTVP